jgi:hypothetical protein
MYKRSEIQENLLLTVKRKTGKSEKLGGQVDRWRNKQTNK